jgi:catechol 2,3-dioxygenase-like lactoylglutathione lyase family enzyme
MLDHIFLTVSNIKRSISFYEAVLAPLGIHERFDFDGKSGPPGYPDLKGFGANGRLFLRLREGIADGRAAHVGFVAKSRHQVDAATRPQLQPQQQTMAHPLPGSTMTRATTLRTCWTLTATASKSSTKVGSIREENSTN